MGVRGTTHTMFGIEASNEISTPLSKRTPGMNREIDERISMVTLKTIDRLVGLLIAGIILFGTYSWWQATQRSSRQNGMMGQMMDSMPGMDPVWYLFGTLIAVSVVFGVYIISRDQLAGIISTQEPAGAATKEGRNEADIPSDSRTPSSDVISNQSDQNLSPNGTTGHQLSALTFLPEDEQQIVRPILESPGLTQVELRGRSGFSKAKVSQTVSKLEDRGLIYREKQGRTYRVYPGELLKDRSNL